MVDTALTGAAAALRLPQHFDNSSLLVFGLSAALTAAVSGIAMTGIPASEPASESAPERRKRARFGLFRRFARREDGSAAVEFAIVAIPFLALTFAIMETALVIYAGQVLENVTANAARNIFTGAAQKAGWDDKRFKEEVCGRVVALFDCANGIKVDVQTYETFSEVDTNPFDENDKLKENFNPGGPGKIVVVRLMYKWPVLTPLMGLGFADMGDNSRLLIATAAFRNEPF
jgi:Flp pilus assembly protein TadG